jgi:methionyl-tRNA formyltransferase
VREELRPDAALSYYCFRRLERPLIDALGGVVNYHDALLPAHRGVWATSFSLLDGDDRTGFTFHWMDEGLDTGPVLLQRAVTVPPGSGLGRVDRAKARGAAAALPALFDLIAARAPGVVQRGAPSYHSREDGERARHVDAPEALPAEELLQRVRAFGEVRLRVGDDGLPVTRLRPCAPDHPRAVRTADGVVLAPDRIAGLPAPLHDLRDRLRRRAAPAG